MNRVFSLVWSCAQQELVVASELARGRGKAAGVRLRMGRAAAEMAAWPALRPIALAVALAAGSLALVAPEAKAGALMNADDCANQGFQHTRIGIGTNAKACSDGVIAIGWGAEAKSSNLTNPPGPAVQSGVAIGRDASATGGVALGHLAVAGGENGDGTNRIGTAIGAGSVADGHRSIAIGTVANRPTETTANWAVALGTAATASDLRALAIGPEAAASGRRSMALGSNAAAEGQGSIAMGSQAEATAPTALASGTRASATAESAVALGVGATASGQNAIATGVDSEASAANAVAMGSLASATGEESIAMGSGAQANALQSISIGTGNIVDGAHSGAIGDPNIVSGSGSYAL
ncbi:ESPR-type extended signal peptide-containing protein, partial [Guyparkeria sp.]|uniref:ESPR-type extended signal peptide-containing protein n=1 Tax=Guyparkeria sp. TaxID=2035736 RepID=UPI003970BC27